MNTKRFQQHFFEVAAVLLFMFAVAALWTAFKSTELVMNRADPFLFLSHRRVFFIASGMALALSAYLFLGRDAWLKLALTGWCSTVFLAYQIGLRWSGESDLFCYVGNMNAFPVSPGFLGGLLLGFSGAACVGSFWFLFRDWRQNPNSKPSEIEVPVKVETAFSKSAKGDSKAMKRTLPDGKRSIRSIQYIPHLKAERHSELRPHNRDVDFMDSKVNYEQQSPKNGVVPSIKKQGARCGDARCPNPCRGRFLRLLIIGASVLRCWAQSNLVCRFALGQLLGFSCMAKRQSSWDNAKLPFFWGVVILSISSFGGYGVEFQISGEIRTETLKGKRIIQIEDFEVFFRDNDWLINVHQKPFSSADSNAMFFTYSSYNLGEEVYTIAKAEDRQNILEKMLAKPDAPIQWKEHPDHIALDMAWLDRSFVPHADARFSLPVLFFAFCSQNYLNIIDKAVEKRLEPPYSVDGRSYSYDDGATNVPAKYERLNAPPFLPLQISFMHDDRWLADVGTWIPLPDVWKNFTNAEFKTVTTTNINGLKLPLAVEMTVFEATDTNASGMVTVPEVRVRVAVKTVAAKCDYNLDKLKPPLSGYTHVTDKRFWIENQPLELRYTTNKWLSKKEVQSLPGFAKAERSHRKTATEINHKGARWIVVLILFCPTILFAPMLFRHASKTKQKPNKNVKKI